MVHSYARERFWKLFRGCFETALERTNSAKRMKKQAEYSSTSFLDSFGGSYHTQFKAVRSGVEKESKPPLTDESFGLFHDVVFKLCDREQKQQLKTYFESVYLPCEAWRKQARRTTINCDAIVEELRGDFSIEQLFRDQDLFSYWVVKSIRGDLSDSTHGLGVRNGLALASFMEKHQGTFGLGTYERFLRYYSTIIIHGAFSAGEANDRHTFEALYTRLHNKKLDSHMQVESRLRLLANIFTRLWPELDETPAPKNRALSAASASNSLDTIGDWDDPQLRAVAAIDLIRQWDFLGAEVSRSIDFERRQPPYWSHEETLGAIWRRPDTLARGFVDRFWPGDTIKMQNIGLCADLLCGLSVVNQSFAPPDFDKAAQELVKSLHVLRTAKVRRHVMWCDWYITAARLFNILGKQETEVQALRNVEALYTAMGSMTKARDARQTARDRMLNRSNGSGTAIEQSALAILIDAVLETPPSLSPDQREGR